MEAMNKRRENLIWPDEDKTRKQLEAIREIAKELRMDYPTDTADEPTNRNNEARNRRNTLIRAQFSTDKTAWHLINGTEWLELFDLLGFSVDKETRKRFTSHLNWYSFWYADFKPRLSSKYAQRIHWYVYNFLFCLRNKLQTEKDYREGKYGSKGQAYFMKIEKQPATPSETPQNSTETAETVNVSAEGESEAERKEIKVQTIADMVAIGESLNKGESVSFKLHLHFLWSVTITNESAEWCEGFKYSLDAKCLDNPQSFGRRYTSFGLAMLHCLNRFHENANIRDDYETLSAVLNKPQNLISDFRAPQSPETPQAAECTSDSGCRVCSHCGKHFHEGWFLGNEYACSEECAVALYGGDRELFEADLETEENEPGTTECYWSVW